MSYKVHYFPIRGRAEVIRVTLALAGQSWEEVPFTSETWPEAKASGKYLFGQVPALETEDGTVLVQCPAIISYLAKKHGLYAEDPLEAYNIDVILASTFDVIEGFVTVNFRTPAEQKEEAMKKFVEENVKKNLTGWAKALGDNKYIANNKLSVADGAAYLLLETFAGTAPQVLEAFPSLAQYYESIKETPGLAEYLASDKRPPASS